MVHRLLVVALKIHFACTLSLKPPNLLIMMDGVQGRTQGGGGCRAAAPSKRPKTEI
jgi:hypothetical protein